VLYKTLRYCTKHYIPLTGSSITNWWFPRS